jgi:hypothetical protein
MSDAAFTHDVFLSHSTKDKAVVRELAKRLRTDGLEVWPVPPKRLREGRFDQCVLKPGNCIPAKTSELQHLALSLCPTPR